MKKLTLWTAGLCMMSLFAACDEDQENQPGGSDYVESMRVTNFDQKKFLQDNLVETDSAGQFVQRVNGVPLDPADTTVLYVGVKDVAEAKAIFKSWLAPDASPIENGDVVTVDLLDENKNEQGQATFSPKTETEPEPLLAEVSFTPSTEMQFISFVKFVPESSWPNNGESAYFVGDKVDLETYDEGLQKWVCIRPYKQGQNGILVYLSHGTGCWGANYIKNFASVASAKEVAAITSGQWDSFVSIFSDAGMTLENAYYWINDWKYYVFGGGIYSINLKTQHIDWFEIVWKNPYKRYLQTRYFGELN